MKVVFMGTPDFAVPCLQKLIDAGHDICGVFTQPDKPKGRGYTLMPPPVKELALQHGLTVYQPTTLRDDKVQQLIAAGIDCGCSIWEITSKSSIGYSAKRLCERTWLFTAKISRRSAHSVDRIKR